MAGGGGSGSCPQLSLVRSLDTFVPDDCLGGGGGRKLFLSLFQGGWYDWATGCKRREKISPLDIFSFSPLRVHFSLQFLQGRNRDPRSKTSSSSSLEGKYSFPPPPRGGVIKSILDDGRSLQVFQKGWGGGYRSFNGGRINLGGGADWKGAGLFVCLCSHSSLLPQWRANPSETSPCGH